MVISVAWQQSVTVLSGDLSGRVERTKLHQRSYTITTMREVLAALSCFGRLTKLTDFRGSEEPK